MVRDYRIGSRPRGLGREFGAAGLQESESETRDPPTPAEPSAALFEMQLVERARKGDASAYDQIMHRHAKRLYALAASMVGNPADAEDVVQETFLGAYKQLAAFQGRSSLKTWLTRICVLQVSKLYRSRKVRRMAPLGSDVPGGHEPSVGSPVGHADRRADVQAMLASLSPEHREVLVLRELQGLSYKEIADVLGVPQGTVESRLFRARQQLKESYKDYVP